jgi:hypothetical protein
MHFLAPAGHEILTPGVALSLLHQMLAKNIFPVSASYDLICAPLNQTNKKHDDMYEI